MLFSIYLKRTVVLGMPDVFCDNSKLLCWLKLYMMYELLNVSEISFHTKLFTGHCHQRTQKLFKLRALNEIFILRLWEHWKNVHIYFVHFFISSIQFVFWTALLAVVLFSEVAGFSGANHQQQIKFKICIKKF